MGCITGGGNFQGLVGHFNKFGLYLRAMGGERRNLGVVGEGSGVVMGGGALCVCVCVKHLIAVILTVELFVGGCPMRDTGLPATLTGLEGASWD